MNIAGELEPLEPDALEQFLQQYHSSHRDQQLKQLGRLIKSLDLEVIDYSSAYEPDERFSIGSPCYLKKEQRTLYQCSVCCRTMLSPLYCRETKSSGLKYEARGCNLCKTVFCSECVKSHIKIVGCKTNDDDEISGDVALCRSCRMLPIVLVDDVEYRTPIILIKKAK